MILYFLLVFLILFLLYLLLKHQSNETDESYDLIVHHSTETLNHLDGSIFVINKFGADFVSLHQCQSIAWFGNGAAKDIETGILPDGVTNWGWNGHSPINGWSGLIDESNVALFKWTKFIRIKTPIKIKGNHGNIGYIQTLQRLSDKVEFNFIQLTQSFNGYENVNSFYALSELLKYVAKLELPFIIVGDFNIQNHESVFKFYFGNSVHIFNAVETITSNDGDGLASPDGIVVSKSLYSNVEFEVVPLESCSWQHYVVLGKLSNSKSIASRTKIKNEMYKMWKSIADENTGRQNYWNEFVEPPDDLDSVEEAKEINFEPVKTIPSYTTLFKQLLPKEF